MSKNSEEDKTTTTPEQIRFPFTRGQMQKELEETLELYRERRGRSFE